MKIKFLATGNAPTHYEIDGEIINGIDLSIIEYGGRFMCNEVARQAGIRHAERDEHGELWVTLKQESGSGHWRESDWIDAVDYDPDAIYIRQIDNPFVGKAYALTRQGKQYEGWEVLDAKLV